jgi:tRNA threonylcarbamoyl adenosine modification protein YjeE
MQSKADHETIWTIELPGEAATQDLAQRILPLVGPNALVTLSGDLGAGKTTFARALIRLLTKDPQLEVPSPTFTLMQVYQTPAFPVVHADLYRINDPAELAELGWEEAAEGALLIVEWAEKAGALPADRLDISLAMARGRDPNHRIATITGHGAFAVRVARARDIQALLDRSGWGEAQRAFMLGDASVRAYERLTNPDGAQAILMISPPRPDGPPVRNGKPYSAIARLAEDIRPFIAVDLALQDQGLSAPQILAYDLDAGLAVLEDFGAQPVADDRGPIQDRYGEATAVLATLHASDLPTRLPLDDDESYRLPVYDIDALLIEVELILEWYAPHVARAPLSSSARAAFVNLWRPLLQQICLAPTTWALRDYHSPNLIWLPEREGVRRIGLIDFQDCVLGHPAYDLVSLLQDARVTVSDELELKLLSYYARLRRNETPDFNMMDFARAYAVLGAQRATKILGIFARLDRRDGKPQYLAHLPRVERYLAKDLAHPDLAPLRAWYETHLPRAVSTRS